MHADALVLGAGIVGVSVAVHLAQRGRQVVLVDRQAPGRATSYGNAGLIQREGVLPRAFPQDWRALLRYARNASTDMHFHPPALPVLAPFLARYWWHSLPERYRKTVMSYATLIAHSVSEHAPLIAAADAAHLVEKNGWLSLFVSPEGRDKAFAEAEWVESEFGIAHARLSGAELRVKEPGVTADFAGALHWRDPWTVKDPGGLVAAYAAYFEKLGGRFVTGDALRLESTAQGWRLGDVSAREAVIALGPWAGDLTRRFGYRLPLGIKRGYHMHYAPDAERPLKHWMLDAEGGYLMAPMAMGLRLTTGAEFARRDAPATPVQVERAERTARTRFAFGARLDEKPWLGARPMTPDMLPVIGPAPRHERLWFAFGHAHHGLTLGPATGRLIAELMTGEEPYVDPTPFSAKRF
jgi:D-amino-acid dehydrogenase